MTAKRTREHPTRRNAPAGERGVPRALRALRHRNYRLFFLGQLISLCGTWMQTVAQSWLVYRLTGSAVLLGLVGFASQIPVFLFAPLGGVVADRHHRHGVLLVTQAASMLLALILAILTLTHVIRVWEIFALAALLGVANAFDMPTRSAFVVDMVGRDDLMNAIALNSSIFNGARIVGPALAGALVAALGEGWCFLLNSLSYIAVLTGLALMKLPAHVKLPPPAAPLSHMAEGFRFVARTPPVRALLLLLGLMSLFGMPYAVLMPIFADRILHGGVSGLGLLMGSSGVGALIAALSLAVRNRLRGLGRWVAFAAAGFGVAIILFSFSRWFWLSACLLVPAGFAMMVQMAGSNTLVQAMVPDALRGRVMSVYSMMFMGMAPFGALLAGSLAQYFGAPATVALGGAVCIAGAALFALRLPSLSVEAHDIIIATQLAAGNPVDEMNAASSAAATRTS
ncbi:MAG TPA: MFS transporter [Steroidobacteraceae bacterium]